MKGMRAILIIKDKSFDIVALQQGQYIIKESKTNNRNNQPINAVQNQAIIINYT
jgi:hypothetical protein